MIERRLYNKIQASIKAYPVVGIIGSRQAGKTTLAKMVRDTIKKKSIYLDLELPSDQDKLFEPELYLLRKLNMMKSTGSGSGVGTRSVIWRNQTMPALRGGILLPRPIWRWIIPQLGIHVPSAQLRRFWTMLAHSHAQLWNANRIAGSMGLSAPTIRRYLDILEDTFIVRQLQPYHANLKKRLIKSPKIYIRDSGMLHSLLRVRTLKDLQDHPSAGSSWEGLVIEQALGILPEGWKAFFYRTSAGAEIDLLLLDDKNKPIAIEIKYSAGARVSRGFWNAFEDLSCTRGFVIYAGDEFYPITKNVYALPLKGMEMIVRR